MGTTTWENEPHPPPQNGFEQSKHFFLLNELLSFNRPNKNSTLGI